MTKYKPTQRPIKIIAIVHGYFPNHNAGAEAMLHQILVSLQEMGHEAIVMTRNPGAKEYEGIKIYDINDQRMNDFVRSSDIIFTHLDFSGRAVRWGRSRNKPVVHLVHNDKQLAYNKIDFKKAQLAIANSAWIADTIRRDIPKTIVYPPTDPSRYEVETTREAITLINMNEAKGGKMFWQLARIFPDKKFIGVKGAYGEQIEYDKDLPNVTIYENTPDVLPIYAQSRIVLMPSSYESWGRVAQEAAASGIPVIVAPTPGLTESLGDSALYAEWDNVADYVEAIKVLDDKKTYDKYSKAVKERSDKIAAEFDNQIVDLDEKLVDLVTRWFGK